MRILSLEPKFHDPGTFGGFGKRGQTNKQTTRFMFYKYRFEKISPHQVGTNVWIILCFSEVLYINKTK